MIAQESVSGSVQGLAVSMVFSFSYIVGGIAPLVVGALDPGDRRIGHLVFGAVVFSYSTSAICFFLLAHWLHKEDLLPPLPQQQQPPHPTTSTPTTTATAANTKPSEAVVVSQ